MDKNQKEDNQTNINKLEETVKNIQQYYNQIDKGHQTSANYYYFLDLHEILIGESKQAKAILEKIDTNGMLQLEQTLFNLTHQATLDWKLQVYEFYFVMKEKGDKVSVRNIADDQNATFFKFIKAFQEFQRFHSLYTKLSNQTNEEFYKYLVDEGVEENAIQLLANHGIGFKLFLQLDSKILKEDLQLTLRERLIVKSILEQFGK